MYVYYVSFDLRALQDEKSNEPFAYEVIITFDLKQKIRCNMIYVSIHLFYRNE